MNISHFTKDQLLIMGQRNKGLFLFLNIFIKRTKRRNSSMDNTFKYAIKLAMLNQLISNNLISKKEYTAIKNDLMKKHKITLA